MTTFPGSPSVTKGAIVSIGLASVPSVVVLQYNPEQLSRTIRPRYLQTGEVPVESQILVGPPEETISLSAQINAVDQLERASVIAESTGIYPQLSALEMLLFPTSLQVMADVAQMALGVIEVTPASGPVTIFYWGAKRVVPVQITDYTAVETLHDPNLNPIAADVSLTMRVLTYQDFTVTQAGFYLYLSNLVVREGLATIGTVGSIAGLAGLKLP